MKKLIILIFFFFLIAVFSKLRENNTEKNKLRRNLNSCAHCDNCQLDHKFMIISRATAYNLSLALRYTDANDTKYYWTVTNQNVNAIPNTYTWVQCDSGLKNLYINQYLMIDEARNAILVYKKQTNNVVMNSTIYPGYTVIQRNGEFLTALDDGTSFFAGSYQGTQFDIYQQWNIHYF